MCESAPAAFNAEKMGTGSSVKRSTAANQASHWQVFDGGLLSSQACLTWDADVDLGIVVRGSKARESKMMRRMLV